MSLIGCTTRAFAFEKWNTEEKLMWGIKTALMYIDWKQTKYISNHPDEYYEKYNHTLGEHPSEQKVNWYFSGSYIIQTILVSYIPRDSDIKLFGESYHIKPRRIFQSFTIGVSGFCVGNNLKIGITFKKIF